MPVTLTIREVPEAVRNVLARIARQRGQSLQAFLLYLLEREAAFDRNREVLAEIAQGHRTDPRTDDDLLDIPDVIHQARAARDEAIISAITEKRQP
ncbi:MAG: hypothetical protein ICV70_01410 [Jiangellaceae bacterium]|nr:hypothetical protein [Jiangellaceae bacterium]